jgi:DNA polymerase III subunit alpha
VADFINYSKDNDISVGPGRGSAAGSLVCWAMRITDCNPIQHGLLFERFLNPERRGLPDIDVDFEQQRRDEVVTYVRNKYGQDRVGQILTVGRMKAKQAIKDVARAWGVQPLDAQAWSDRIEDGPKVKLKASLDDPHLASSRVCSTVFRHVSDLALKLEGLPRQLGVHAAGVVVASDPLEDYCPLHYDPGEGRTCVGLDMGSAEKIGLVKFDFLGLKTLDVIEMARKSVHARTGMRPQVLDELLDDPEVFKMVSAADTLGLFQIESPGMINLIRKMKPDRFDDVVAILALFRPGPLGTGMVDDYVERKHGQQEVRYVHDLLAQVLEPTYGILVYQEQIMKAAQILAGYSLGEADLLRRAMGKKKPEEMAQQGSIFQDGCAKNGIDQREAERIFELISYFSGYGFNKSHSAAYALITYQTAKLKAHYRADFMAAAMTFDSGNHDQLRAYVSDTRRAGILVLPPDVNHSMAQFTVEGDPPAVRYGLQGIKGLGGGAALQILLQERTKNGPYRSLSSLRERTSLGKNVLEALVWSGAVDSLEKDRHDAWWSVTRKPSKELSKRIPPGQIGLFSGRTAQEEHLEKTKAEDLEGKPEPPSFAERMEREAKALGTILSDHPLRRFRDVVSRIRTHSLRNAHALRSGISIAVAGHIESLVRAKGRNDDEYVRLLLEDGDGSIQIILRGPLVTRVSDHLKVGACIKVEGKVDSKGEEAIIDADAVESLASIRTRVSRMLEIDLEPQAVPRIEALARILDERTSTSGSTIRIRFLGREGVRLAELDRKVELLETDLDRIERITGRPDSVHLPGGKT